MVIKQKAKAFAYLRTSSPTNKGPEKDSDKRQREAIATYAEAAGFEIVGEFYDLTKGENAISERPQFARMLEAIAGNGVRTIIVETANRFARDLIVQETGWKILQEQGIALIAADSPAAFVDDGPTAKLIRQVLGAVAEFEKTMLVSKLAGARARRIAKGEKCGGRKSYAEINPQMVAEAKRLRRKLPKGGQRSFREVAEELARLGYTTRTGRTFNPAAVKAMCEA